VVDPIKKNKGRLLGVHCSAAGGVENAPLIAQRLGCSAFQLFTGPNRQWRAKRLTRTAIQAFKRNVAQAGIRSVVAHAVYLINLAAPDGEIWRKSRAAMVGEVKRAQELSIPWVIVHPGSHKGKGTAWGVKRIAEAINRTFDETEGMDAGIALEVTAGQGDSIGHRFEELAAIIDFVEDRGRVRVCFDTCHAFAAGYELRTEEGYELTMRDFDRELGIKNLIAIHLNDSRSEIASRVDRHTHIGEGKIGREGFKLILNDPRLNGVAMILETPKEEDVDLHDSRNLSMLRRMIK
jgi:deoxyribonuclease-4